MCHFRHLWNGMFDRHRVEITVMQFTGHSLPVHQSVTVPWDFNPVPYCQPSSPMQMEYTLPPSLEWHVWRGRRSIYNRSTPYSLNSKNWSLTIRCRLISYSGHIMEKISTNPKLFRHPDMNFIFNVHSLLKRYDIDYMIVIFTIQISVSFWYLLNFSFTDKLSAKNHVFIQLYFQPSTKFLELISPFLQPLRCWLIADI